MVYTQKSFTYLVSLSACVALLAVQASAENFDLSFSDGVNYGSFILATSSLGGGQFLITNLYGDFDGQKATLYPGGPAVFVTPPIAIPGGTGDFEGDNVLYFPASPQYLDDDGLVFTQGSTYYNLFGLGGGVYDLYTLSPTSNGFQFTTPWVYVNSTPSPAAVLPFGAGLLALRRRRRA